MTIYKSVMIACIAVIASNEIYAEDNQNDNGLVLEEITVTAQRRDENLQDVPISVQSFSGDALERTGIQSTADLELLTPSLVYSQGIGLGSPYLRGIGTGGNGPGTENSVAVYSDGVYVGTKSSSLSSLANVERVEVLKGPQGTLFGRNATGGLIHIITKAPPTDQAEMAVKVGYGNYDTKSFNFAGGVPLGDKLGASFSVDYQDQGEGWGENLVSGNDANEVDNTLARLKLVYQASDATTVTVTGYYDDTEKSIGVGPRLLDGALPAAGADYVFPATGGTYDTNGDTESVFASESSMVALKIEHDFEFANFTSISAYQESEYSALLDNDVTPLPLAVATVLNEENQFSQELKLSSHSGENFEWTLGAYAYFGDGDQVVGLSGASFSFVQELLFNGKQKTDSFAIYAQVSQQLGEKTRLTGGLRHTWDEREISGSRDRITLGGEFVSAPITPESSDFNEFTWRLALDRQLSSDVMGYISYNRGFKSGLYNASFLQSTPVNPELLDAYEVGFKSELLERRLRLNATAFYYDYTDIQLTQFVNSIAILRNAAEAEIYGIEVETEYLLNNKLTLTGGLSWMKGTYESFEGAGFAVPNPAGGNTVVPGDATGNEIARTPRLTANATLNYSTQLASGNEFSFDLSLSYNDGYFTEPDNLLSQDSYHLVNARAQVDFMDDQMSASVWGKNLTDELYTSVLTAQAIGDIYSPSAPRTFGVSLEYRF